MEFLTVQEAAERWKISPRLVQRYCVDGRIPGARKFSGAWAIPAGTQKPEDPRRSGEAALPPEQQSAPMAPMPLMNTPFAPGRCQEAIQAMEDPEQREIALAEYCYFSGQPEKAILLAERYLSHEEPALRLSACLIYTFANLSLGQIHRARAVLAEINQLAKAGREAASPLRVPAAFVAVTAAVLLHLPVPEEEFSLLQAQIRLLPPGLRIFALYVQAHHAYLQGDYGRSVGIAEAVFSLESQTYPIPAIYLHLAAVMSYMGLKQLEQAQAHLRAAWALARPDDLIQGLGEHHGLLGGMLEAVLKKDDPEQADHRHHLPLLRRVAQGPQPGHRPRCGGQPHHHRVRHRHAGGPGVDQSGDRRPPGGLRQYGEAAHLPGPAEAGPPPPPGSEHLYADMTMPAEVFQASAGITHFPPRNG